MYSKLFIAKFWEGGQGGLNNHSMSGARREKNNSIFRKGKTQLGNFLCCAAHVKLACQLQCSPSRDRITIEQSKQTRISLLTCKGKTSTNFSFFLFLYIWTYLNLFFKKWSFRQYFKLNSPTDQRTIAKNRVTFFWFWRIEFLTRWVELIATT